MRHLLSHGNVHSRLQQHTPGFVHVFCKQSMLGQPTDAAFAVGCTERQETEDVVSVTVEVVKEIAIMRTTIATHCYGCARHPARAHGRY